MSGWGREDESSSSISTSSSSHSRRQEPDIDVFAVRNRIVDRIMAKKQKEESEKSKATRGSSRNSRAPLADLAQSQENMELTQAASTSSDARNLNWTLDSTKRPSKVYSSTPLPGRAESQSESRASSSFVAPRPKTPTKSKPPKTSVIPEHESEEEEPPPPPSVQKKGRGRPKKTQAGPPKKPAAKPRPRSPTPEPEPPLFGSSDDEDPQVEPALQSDEEEQAGRSARQTSRVSISKSPTRSAADRSRTVPPRSPARAPRETPAKPTQPTPAKPTKSTPAKPTKSTAAKPTKPTPAKPAKPTPAKSSRATPSQPTPQASADSPEDPGPSTSRAEDAPRAGPSRTSSRRKAPPQKSTVVAKTNKLYKELRRLQSEPGFLIPRLPFMRVVREIASNVTRENTNFKFTVDAMEAIQTATEYYLTSVFTDAAALANHAHRVTVMPRDLDLLRKLRVVDM